MGRAEHPQQEPHIDPYLPILPCPPWVWGHHRHPSRATRPLPTSAVLDGQGDDGDAEQQGQGDGDGAEHQLQLAARGQAAQQRPRPLPKPHLGRSRTCHRTARGTEPHCSPYPTAPWCLVQLCDEVGMGAFPAGVPRTPPPSKPVVGTGGPPSCKEGRWPRHTLCCILAASQHVPEDSLGWLGSQPCFCCPLSCRQALAVGEEGARDDARGKMEGPAQTSPPHCQEMHFHPPLAPAPRRPAAWHACSQASAKGGSRLGWACGGCPLTRYPLQLLQQGQVPTQWMHGRPGQPLKPLAVAGPPPGAVPSPRWPQEEQGELLVGSLGAHAGASLYVTMAAVASALLTGATSPQRRGPCCLATIA